MNNKYFLGIIIIVIAVLGVLLAFSINSPIDVDAKSNSRIDSVDKNSSIDSDNKNSTNPDDKNSLDSNNKNSTANSKDTNNGNNFNNQNKIQKDVELTITAEQSFPVEKMVEEIKTHPYYKGYDKDTLNWLESFNGSVMFTSKENFVVMSKSDASKLPTSFVNDAFIYDDFKCDIIENHSLGNDLKDILYVENVKFENQWIKPIDF